MFVCRRLQQKLKSGSEFKWQSKRGVSVKKYTVIANWKMYLSFDSTITQVTDHFDALVTLANNKNVSLFLAPTLPAIPELAIVFKETPVGWCAQDCSEHIAGAYTGQVSPEALKAIGCNACIIGHSERRKYCGETDEAIAHKLQALLDYNLSPVICIGEHEEGCDFEQAVATLERQLKPIFDVLTAVQHKINGLPVYFAYEPVWSIGTGKIADELHLENIYVWLQQQIHKYAPSVSGVLLYGGSVNANTIKFFKKFDRIQGFLVGKASLDFQEFEKILKCIMVE